MNAHHEQLKNRINELESARNDAIVVGEKYEAARKVLGEKNKAVDTARQQLARTIWNKCQGKQLIHAGTLYKVSKRQNKDESLHLTIETFNGEIL